MSRVVSTVRIVRCPKCRGLLTEFADIPMYRCGRCGAVLQAKNRQATNGDASSQILGSNLSEKNLPQLVLEKRDSSNDEPNSNSPSASCITSVAHAEYHGHSSLSPKEGSCSMSVGNYYNKEEASEYKEDLNIETVTRDERMNSPVQPSIQVKESSPVASPPHATSVQVNMDHCSNEKEDNSSEVRQRGSIKSCSLSKIDVAGSCFVSEDVAVADAGSVPSQKTNSPSTRSAHSYDGDDSFCDAISNSREEEQLLLSPAVGMEEVSDPKSNEVKDDKENKFLEDVEDPHPQTRRLCSNSSNERFASLARYHVMDSNFRSSNVTYSRWNSRESRHSEIFHSARRELEDDLLSMSISKESSSRDLPWNGKNHSPSSLKNLENDRMELLKKVDELRDHLTRSYALGQKRNQRYHIQGTKKDSNRPLFSNHRYERLPHYSNPHLSRTQHCSHFSGTVQSYRSLKKPLALHGCDSCLHLYPDDWCTSLQLPHEHSCGSCTYHACCYSSTSPSPICDKDINATLYSHKSQSDDQHLEKPQYIEKKHSFKRHCRPVSRGTPFVICSNCMQLLHLPADFLVSKARYHRLKCEGCSEVLTFFTDGGHILPHEGTQVDPPSTEVDSAVEDVRRDELSVDQSDDYLQMDPVSCSEESGPPLSIGYSTDGDPVSHNVSNPPQHDRRCGKQAIGSTLHRLMGYDSVTELIYKPSEDDESYDCTEYRHGTFL